MLPDIKHTYWTRLITDHYAALAAFFRRRAAQPWDSQDLVQEVYLRLLRMEQTRSQEEDSAIRNPEAYLYTVARNLLREHAILHKRLPKGVALDALAPEWLAVEDSSEADFDKGVRSKQLKAMLGRLPVRNRNVLILHYRDEMTYQQIGERLKVSSHMVKKLVVQGLALCRRDGIHKEDWT